MVAITATNVSTPLKPVSPNRSRLEQVRRQADQAEANARQLRALADQAEQESQQNQSKVSTLSAQVAQESRAAQAAPTDTTYTAQVKPGASTQTKQVQDFLVRISAVALNQFTFPDNPLKSGASTAPVLNAQGQSTGRIVNLSV
jgi:hypothetical protein